MLSAFSLAHFYRSLFRAVRMICTMAISPSLVLLGDFDVRDQISRLLFKLKRKP